ncbi:hypothetical protein SK128_021209 [Halocaridina rubra]|uniref:Uncharacterized protein n=1 Tax=Halocaridina rubra TaxID=373956 RepID=A0AAN9A166_HALRR
MGALGKASKHNPLLQQVCSHAPQMGTNCDINEEEEDVGERTSICKRFAASVSADAPSHAISLTILYRQFKRRRMRESEALSAFHTKRSKINFLSLSNPYIEYHFIVNDVQCYPGYSRFLVRVLTADPTS